MMLLTKIEYTGGGPDLEGKVTNSVLDSVSFKGL